MRERCEKREREFLVAAELGNVGAVACVGELLDKDDPQRFVWLGRAASNGKYASFLNEMSVRFTISIPELDMLMSCLLSDEL
jgi:hypothetical protein